MAIATQQFAYRIRTDSTAAQGGTPVWAAAQNVPWANPSTATPFRIRFLIENTGSTTTASTAWNLYCSRNGGAYAAVTTTGTYVKSIDASGAHSTDNSAISTALLTGGSGTFANGQYDDTGSAAAQALAATHYTEFEFGIEFTASAVAGDTYAFQVRLGTAALNTYASGATPYFTIGSGVAIDNVSPEFSVSSATSVSAASFNLSTSADALLVAVLVDGVTAAPTGFAVTWDSGGTNQAMTLIKGQANSTGGYWLALYGLLAPTQGSKVLKVAATGSMSHVMGAMVAFDNVLQTSLALAFPNSTSNSGTIATAAQTLAVTSASGNFAVCVSADDDGTVTSLAATNSTTLFTDSTGAPDGAAAFAPGTSSVTFTHTAASSGYDGAMAGCSVASASGGPTAWSGTAALHGAGALSCDSSLITPISNPVLAACNSPNWSTQSVTTTVDIPAGSLIVVGAGESAQNTDLSSGVGISDGINTYSYAVSSGPDAGQYSNGVWYCSNCLHVPSGTVINVTGSTTLYINAAEYCTGANGGLHLTNKSVDSAETSFSLSVGAPGGLEIAFGSSSPGSGYTTYTEGAGFIQPMTPNNLDGALSYSKFNAAMAWAPSWTPSQISTEVIATFKQTPSATAWSGSAALAGAGSLSVPSHVLEVAKAAFAGTGSLSASVTYVSGTGISLPIIVATNTTFNSSTLTTTADIPAGSAVIVGLSPVNPDVSITSVSDGIGGDTYAIYQNSVAANVYNGGFGVLLNTPVDIPAGTTFTAAASDAGICFIVNIFYLTGANGGVDKVASNTGDGTSFSLSTGTLATANEIALGGNVTANGENVTTNFTNNFYQFPGGSTSSISYSGSWSPTDFWSAIVITLKASTGVTAWQGVAALAGAGSLNVSASIRGATKASFAGAGSLLASISTRLIATTALTGVGALSASITDVPAGAIGTPVPLNTISAYTVSGSGVATDVDAPAGSLLVAIVWGANYYNGTVASVIDSAGNTWVQAAEGGTEQGFSFEIVPTSIWYCLNSQFDLPSGGTITATMGGNENTYFLAAFSVSGANWSFDQASGNQNTSASTSCSIATGTLASSNSIVFGAVAGLAQSGLGTVTEGLGGTELANYYLFGASYAITSSTSPQTYAPSWTSSQQNSFAIAAFYSNVSAPTAWPGSSSLGGLGGGLGPTVHQIDNATANFAVNVASPTVAAAILDIALAAFSGTSALAPTIESQTDVATSALIGVGGLAVSSAIRQAAASAFVGTGALNVPASILQVATSAFSGTGSLSSSAIYRLNAASAFTGLGSANVTAALIEAATATLSGAGILGATVYLTAGAALVGTGSLVTSASLAQVASGTFAGAGALVTTLAIRQTASAAFTGVGGLSVPALLIQIASTAFAGVGSLAVPVSLAQQGLVTTLAGAVSASTVAASNAQSIAATLAANGSLATSAVILDLAKATFAGSVAASTPAASINAAASSAFAGTSSLTDSASEDQVAIEGFQASGALSVTPSIIEVATAAFAGVSALTTSAPSAINISATFAGAGALTAVIPINASTVFAGSSGLSVTAAIRETANAALAGAGAFANVPLSIVQAVKASFAGQSSLSSLASTLLASTAALSGTGLLTGSISSAFLAAFATVNGQGALGALASSGATIVSDLLAGNGGYNPYNSGQASTVTAAVTAAAGDLVVMATDRIGNFNSGLTSFVDSTGNTYNIVQPANDPGCNSIGLCWCVLTFPITTSTTWTAVTQDGNQWALYSGVAIHYTGTSAWVLDTASTINQPAASTSNALTTGAMGGTGDVVVGGIYYNDNAVGTGAQASGFTQVFGNVYVDFHYQLAGSSASIPDNITFGSSAYSAALLTFRQAVVNSGTASLNVTGSVVTPVYERMAALPASFAGAVAASTPAAPINLKSAAALTPQGTLSNTSQLLVVAKAALAASTALTNTADQLLFTGQAAFAAVGAFANTVTSLRLSAIANLVSVGTLTANALPQIIDTAELFAGAGALVATPALRLLASVQTFAGVGSLAADSQAAGVSTGSAALAPVGSLSVPVTDLMAALAAFAPVGSLSTQTTQLEQAKGAFAGTASFAPTFGQIQASALAALAAQAALTSNASPQIIDTAEAFNGVANLTARPSLRLTANGLLAALAGLSANVTPISMISAALSPTAAMAATTLPPTFYIYLRPTSSFSASATEKMAAGLVGATFGSVSASSTLVAQLYGSLRPAAALAANALPQIIDTAELFAGRAALVASGFNAITLQANLSGSASMLASGQAASFSPIFFHGQVGLTTKGQIAFAGTTVAAGSGQLLTWAARTTITVGVSVRFPLTVGLNVKTQIPMPGLVPGMTGTVALASKATARQAVISALTGQGQATAASKARLATLAALNGSSGLVGLVRGSYRVSANLSPFGLVQVGSSVRQVATIAALAAFGSASFTIAQRSLAKVSLAGTISAVGFAWIRLKDVTYLEPWGIANFSATTTYRPKASLAPAAQAIIVPPKLLLASQARLTVQSGFKVSTTAFEAVVAAIRGLGKLSAKANAREQTISFQLGTGALSVDARVLHTYVDTADVTGSIGSTVVTGSPFAIDISGSVAASAAANVVGNDNQLTDTVQGSYAPLVANGQSDTREGYE